MDPTILYHQAEAGDPYALAAVRSLTARVRSGRASQEDRAAHAELVRMHARGMSAPPHQDVDDATYGHLSALMSRIARRPLHHPQIGAGHGGGGGGHGGGGSHGGGGGGHGGGHGGGGFHHGGGGFRRGGGWGGGWGWPGGWGYDLPCYWEPAVGRYVCWTPYGWTFA